jgi:hypothetical protein
MNTADNKNQLAEVAAKIVGETIRASGTRLFLSEVVKELINGWAQKGGIRGKFAPLVHWVVSKVLQPGKNRSGRGISADVGRLFTLWARKVNADHAIDPIYHARTTGDTIHNFLKNTDFGEIREMVESSEPFVLKTVEAFNEQLWKYPAKVGSILATLLAVVNTAIRSVRELLRPIEKNVGPDLLADLILSLLKGINAKEASNLYNSLCEFIRRLHTGNYLLAKAGKPLFQVYLTSLLQEALPNLDPVLIRKAKVALAEDKEAIAHALSDALTENPAYLIEMVSAYGSLKTPVIKGTSRKIRLYEEVDREALAEATSKGLSDLDTFELAEVINGFLRVLNRIHESRPEVFSNITRSIFDSVNAEEIKATSQWLIPELVDAARPILTASMPQLINGLCGILNPQEGLVEDDNRKAILNLKAVLLAAGGET